MLVDADGYTVDFADVPTLPGDHNAQNAACACAACRWLGVPRERIVAGLTTLSRPAAPPGAGRVASATSSTSTTARRPTPTPRRARCRAIDDIYWIPAARRRRAASRRSRRCFERIRHAFLIGEATETVRRPARGQGRLQPLRRPEVGARRRARRARSARRQAPAPWCCCRRPAPRSTSARVSSSAAMRSAPWRAPCRARRSWGEQHDPGSARRPQRDRPLVVDRRPLDAGRRRWRIMAFGVMLTLAAAPPAAERIGARLLPSSCQAPVHLPAGRAGADARRSRCCRRAASGGWRCWCSAAASLLLAADLRHRHRDQGRAALDLGARPVELQPSEFVKPSLRRDLRLAVRRRSRAERRAPGYILVDPAGRRACWRCWCCSPTSA